MRMIFRVIGGERLAVESVERIDVVAPLAPVPTSVGKVGAVVRRVALAEMTRLDPGRERNLAESIGQDRSTLLGDRVALGLFIDGKRQRTRRREKWRRSEKRQQRYCSEPVVHHLSVLLSLFGQQRGQAHFSALEGLKNEPVPGLCVSRRADKANSQTLLVSIRDSAGCGVKDF